TAGDIKETTDDDDQDEIDKEQARETHFVCLFVFSCLHAKLSYPEFKRTYLERPVFVYKLSPYLLFSKERILSPYYSLVSLFKPRNRSIDKSMFRV
ncbi:hypothetical protein CSUI_006522, partial [Cystoisospora suis]